ncbi:hypothetical protein NQ317_009179 [Molorchus minor]|uniref:Uncharacterized protein n=1 Tax=Molorchus minor TaxID=1323400 RepID=A0ABQ9J0A9_9CUCU|nr:hypothetical protein NQ317_009179 [Molorchus minor]
MPPTRSILRLRVGVVEKRETTTCPAMWSRKEGEKRRVRGLVQTTAVKHRAASETNAACYKTLALLHTMAPDECKWVVVDSGSEDDVALVCWLRTINSELENTNFSVIQPQHTVRLRLECSDALFFQSSLSAGSFKPLVELRELSIEYCKIGNLSDGAFQRLDLGENNVWSLPEGVLCPLYALEVLNLARNRLREITSFRFSTNPSERCGANFSLPPELFTDTRDIREMYLQNNSINVLAPSLFSELTQLLVLDLAHNELTADWINTATFAGLVRLVVLDISYNRISKLEQSVFRDLYSLQILRINDNFIESIPENTFSALYNLHTLIVSNNKLAKSESDTFNGLFDLHLNGNKPCRVPDVLNNVPLLKTLDLGENHIDIVTNDTFGNLKQIYGLRLTENNIGNITKGVFDKMAALKILNLSRNKIQKVAPGAFDNNLNLQAIQIAKFVWLNISDNQLKWFDYALIPTGLQWLDIHANQIEELGKYLKNRIHVVSVSTFDASSNKLTEITGSAIPNSVEVLFLNDNLISKSGSNALRISAVPPEKDLPEFYIGGNPYQCDCTMEWLQGECWESSAYAAQLDDLESIYCQLLYNRGQTYVPLVEAAPYQFLCTYETHCFALCHCCDFDACDCEMTCPLNCTCYHGQSWSANVLYLDGNDLRSLNSHAFIGRKRLKILFLNNSNIEIIQNRTFNGLKEMEVLHLDGNRLAELHGYEFEGLDNLREVFLQNNRITNVNNLTFANLRNCEF